jgi:ATP-dependent RNA helicase DeaD
MPSRAVTVESLAGFASLDLDPRALAALAALGYEEPTPIQRVAIPPQMAGRDVLAQAATGTGKTAAFALPLLHHLNTDAPPRERTSALVLVPTRELAMQVAEAVYRYGKDLGAVAMPIYGGTPMDAQIRSLKRGVDVIIATPGRALDHIRRKTIHLAHLRTVVLDEADEMLDMGFADDLEAILAATPAEKRVALFSATLAPRIMTIAKTHLRNPEVIQIEAEPVKAGQIAKVRQVAYIVGRAHKMAALGRILDVEQPTSAIVFCRTRTEVDELTETMNARGYQAEALHGGLTQVQRDRVMKKFRAKTSQLLIATDVAARGLDVQHVSHVVNYDVPSAADAYVHRIGRTGRAGREGVAITLAEPREQRMLRTFERATGRPIETAPVPTVADLEARRLQAVQDAVRKVIAEGGLEVWRSAAAALVAEFDALDVAAASMKHALGGDDSAAQEIPSSEARKERHPAREREADRAERRTARTGGTARTGTAARSGAPARTGGKRSDAAKLYVGAGRKLKVRPGDIVGAIVNETGVDATTLGGIHIFDRHSIIEVPADEADRIVAALSASTIKGKKILVRRDRAG